MNNILTFANKPATQLHFCQVLPCICGSKDFAHRVAFLEKVDAIFKGGLDSIAARMAWENYLAAGAKEKITVSLVDYHKEARTASLALRTSFLKYHLRLSLRALHLHIAESQLARKFCGIDTFGKDSIRVPSRSMLHRYSVYFSKGQMDKLLGLLSEQVGLDVSPATGVNASGLETPIDMTEVFVDSTCLEANIHHPIDWVLLVDSARTLLKSVACIRRHNLRCRMKISPTSYMARMNSLSMALSASSHKKDGRKGRKKVYRSMKKLLKTIEEHALRHRTLLEANWKKTDLGRGEKDVIISHMDNVLSQLPSVLLQADTRIIQNKLVENSKKTLSLYEKDIHVIKRGKSGAQIEFGNTLFICETRSGFIAHHSLEKKTSPGDAKLLERDFEKIKISLQRKLNAIAGDRAFDTKQTRKLLHEENLKNGITPRNVVELEKRVKDPEYLYLHKRRSQTEGRIGILKNVYLDTVLRAKGYEHRAQAVCWGVLVNNLVVIAERLLTEEHEREKRKRTLRRAA